MTVRQWQFSETFIWTFNKNNFIYLKSIETEILLLLSYSPNIHTVKTKPGRCQESHTPSGSPVSVAGAQLMGQHAAIPVHRQMNWKQSSHDSNPFDRGCGYHMQWLIPLCYNTYLNYENFVITLGSWNSWSLSLANSESLFCYPLAMNYLGTAFSALNFFELQNE